MKLNDKRTLQQLRVDIDTALIPLKEKYNLRKLDAGNIRYEGDGLSAKIQLVAEAFLDAGQKSREQSDFETYAEMYGIAKDAFGKTFKMLSGESYIVAGFDRKRRAKPFMIRSVKNGKIYITTADALARFFPNPPLSAKAMAALNS